MKANDTAGYLKKCKEAMYYSCMAFVVIVPILTMRVLALAAAAVIRHLTRNELLMYAVGGGLLLLLAVCYFTNTAAFEGLLPAIVTQLSLFERFYAFVNGVFDMTAMVYYASVIAFFLFLSVQSLEKRRYN